MSYTTSTYRGTIKRPTGAAYKGRVTAIPNTVIRDSSGGLILGGPTDPVELDATGTWQMVLPANDPTLNPTSGIGYTFTYDIDGDNNVFPPQTVAAQPAGTTLNMADILGPDPLLVPVVTLRGLTGDPSAFELRGTGAPEGVVTANPGVYYTDSAGTNGAWRWVKSVGTGNTGWRVIYGDTGWRLMANLPGVASGTAAIRRVNYDVLFYFDDLTFTVDTVNPVQVVSLPLDGFRSEFVGTRFYVNHATNSTVSYEVWVADQGVFVTQRITPTNRVGVLISDPIDGSGRAAITKWVTAWPTTLPGTPI